MKEAELQEYVVDDIQLLNFFDKIELDSFDYAVMSGTDSINFFDWLVDSRYRAAVRDILCALKDDLEIINISDGKIRGIGSISMDKNRLLPDILAFSVNSEQYFIVELKTSGQMSRQSLTELYAYEEEILNHFPMLERNNIHKIIISTQFNSTLRHAVSNAIIKGDSILCLKPVCGVCTVEKYVIQDVLEWTPMSYEVISKKILEGITWCFYQASDYKGAIAESEAVQDMKFAVDCLRDVESEYGGSGFCFVWKRKQSENEISPMSTDYGVTVFGVNSYLVSVKHLAQQTDYLSKYAVRNFSDHDFYEYSGLVLKKSSNRIQELLSDKYFIMFETVLSLPRYEEHLKDCYVVHIDAWGVIGQEMRRLYYTQKARLFQNCAFGEQDVFFKLLTQMFEDYPYRRSNSPGEAFWLGVYIRSLIETIRLQGLTKRELECVRKLWNVVYCSVLKLYPKWIGPQSYRVNNKSLPSILQTAEQVRQAFADRSDSKFFNMGWRYAGLFKETNGVTIPIEHEIEDLEGNDIFEATSVPQELKQYFVERLDQLILRCQGADDMSENEVSFLWNIFGVCNIQFFDKREDVIRFIKGNTHKQNFAQLPDYAVLEYIRELLNLEG